MPVFTNGGLFIPSKNGHPPDIAPACSIELSSRVCLYVRLCELSDTFFCLTKIVWINPAQVGGGRRPGYGLQFESRNAELKKTIEELLAHNADTQKRSQTL